MGEGRVRALPGARVEREGPGGVQDFQRGEWWEVVRRQGRKLPGQAMPRHDLMREQEATEIRVRSIPTLPPPGLEPWYGP